MSRGLGGSCQVPLAAYAEVEGDTVRLSANADVAVTFEEQESGEAV